jgi:magnesium chelatase family protein
MPNALLAGHEIEERGQLKPDARRLLHEAISRLGLSGRAYHRVLKVSRTSADLEPSTHVGAGHVAEALHYRGISRASA